jgi:glycosyltransferase involved in cell wall biosynthesis
MNITIVSPYAYGYFNKESGPTPGGAQRQQYIISKELKNKGHQISFIVGDFGQNSVETIDQIKFINGAPTQSSNVLSDGKSLIELVWSMSTANSDLYLVRGSPKLATATYYIAQMLRKPFIFRLANDSDVDPQYLEEKYSKPMRYLFQNTISGAAEVMVQTNRQKNMLKQRMDINPLVVPNGYDVPPSEELVPHKDREGILWVGSSDQEQKKPERFLELADQLPNKSFKMISKPLPTDKGYHKILQQKAEKRSNLLFLGEISPNKVHKHYQKAKFLVNTSDYEGFPNTFLEAWRYETPVISLYFDPDDLLKSTDIGIHSEDMTNMIDDVVYLNESVDERMKMGKAGRNHVVENHSLERVVDKYEKIFHQIIRDHSQESL